MQTFPTDAGAFRNRASASLFMRYHSDVLIMLEVLRDLLLFFRVLEINIQRVGGGRDRDGGERVLS